MRKSYKVKSKAKKQSVVKEKPVAKSAANIEIKTGDKSPVQIGDHNNVNYQ